MRIAVTGGAGYIGSVVCEVLAADRHEVLVLDNLVKSYRDAAYNLGCGGSGYSVREVVNWARRVTGRNVPERIAPRRPGDPAILITSSARMSAVSSDGARGINSSMRSSTAPGSGWCAPARPNWHEADAYIGCGPRSSIDEPIAQPQYGPRCVDQATPGFLRSPPM